MIPGFDSAERRDQASWGSVLRGTGGYIGVGCDSNRIVLTSGEMSDADPRG